MQNLNVSDEDREEYFRVAWLSYEESCVKWTPEKGPFPIPPETSPPITKRFRSHFDDGFFLDAARRNFILCVRLSGGSVEGYSSLPRTLHVPKPICPHPLKGKPPKLLKPLTQREIYPHREIVKKGLNISQVSALMQTAEDSGYLPVQVIRELIMEFLDVKEQTEIDPEEEKKRVGRPYKEHRYCEVVREGLTLSQAVAVTKKAQEIGKEPVDVIRNLIDEHLVQDLR